MAQSPCAESCLSQVPQSRFGRVGSGKQNGHVWGTEMRPSSPMAKGKSLGGASPTGQFGFLGAFLAANGAGILPTAGRAVCLLDRHRDMVSVRAQKGTEEDEGSGGIVDICGV